jgi:hypothetical protein
MAKCLRISPKQLGVHSCEAKLVLRWPVIDFDDEPDVFVSSDMYMLEKIN